MPRYRTPPTSIGFGKPSRRDATKRMRNRGMTYADFCCFATTLEALTCAGARTVVWAATANILTCKVCVCFKDGGCGNAGSRAAGRLLLWTLSVRKWMEKIFERSFLARLLAKTRGGYLKAELVILKLVFLCNPKITPLLNLNFTFQVCLTPFESTQRLFFGLDGLGHLFSVPSNQVGKHVGGPALRDGAAVDIEFLFQGCCGRRRHGWFCAGGRAGCTRSFGSGGRGLGCDAEAKARFRAPRRARTRARKRNRVDPD
jgi:hypothetical protein